MEEFSIHFEDDQFEDLYKRIAQGRMPLRMDDDAWEHGIDGSFLESLLTRWQNGYNWRAREKKLNSYPQYLCDINGTRIHFFHVKSAQPAAIPVLLTHGWPDCFLRYTKLFDLLPAFDLIVPSLPGFAFSGLPASGYSNNAETAELWHKLMRDVLGYKIYVASGGDMGRGVSCFLAAFHPDEVIGLHLTDVGLVQSLIQGNPEEMGPEEKEYRERALAWLRLEGAYMNIQSTKPQTLAFALADSPIGPAAWLGEKFHAWSDPQVMQMDDILDMLTVAWMTNSICTSIRMYHGNSFNLPPLDISQIHTPTCVTAFPHDVLPAPREWIEKNYSIIQYDETAHGGHFTALEEPHAFAQSLRSFIGKLSAH